MIALKPLKRSIDNNHIHADIAGNPGILSSIYSRRDDYPIHSLGKKPVDNRLFALRFIECIADDQIVAMLDEYLLRSKTYPRKELVLELRDEYADKLPVHPLERRCSVALYVVEL